MKKREWSKVITAFVGIVCVAISIWCTIEYYSLCKLAIIYQSAIMPDATLPVTSITCLLGSILSYMTYQGALKTSLNKHGLTCVSGVVQAIKDNNIPQIISNVEDNIREYEDPVEVKMQDVE